MKIVDFFQNISHKIWKSPLYLAVFLAVVTMISTACIGYYYGTFDQAVHLPFLKKFVDPSLYDHDKFLDLRLTHYSYFWFLFIPFYKWGVLEITLFIIYFISVFLTFLGIWKISKTLFKDPLTSFLSVIIFTFPHFSLAGFPIIEFSLINRVFVLPFLLFSIDLYLNNKKLLAFILLGVLFNLHIISVNFVLVMFLFDSVVRLRKFTLPDLKLFLINVAAFLLFALPVLIWKVSYQTHDVPLNPLWFQMISNSLLSAMYSFFDTVPVTFITISGICTILLYFLMVRKVSSDKNSTITNFMYASILVLIVHVITTEIIPFVWVAQLQIIRVGIFISLFSFIYAARFISLSFQRKEIAPAQFLFLVVVSLCSIWAITSTLILVLQRHIGGVVRAVTTVAIIGLLIFTLYLADTLGVWRPGLNIFPPQTPYYQAQIWAKQNTPKNAVFITPAGDWWIYDIQWRVGSDRAVVASISDFFEAAFTPSFISYWQPRFEDIAPGALSRFNGDAFEIRKITKKAYDSLSTQDIKRIAKKYGANYFVSDNAHNYPFLTVYHNQGFTIYKVD